MRLTPLIAAVILTLNVSGPLASTVVAAPPDPVEFPLDLPAGAVCAFAVLIEVSGKTKTIDLPGGRLIVTAPGQNATITNRENQNQVTLNITGAFHQSTAANGDVTTVATGRNLLFDPTTGFVLARGRFSYVFDANGDLKKSLTGKGPLTDVCALLT